MSMEREPGYPPLTEGQKQAIRDGMRNRAQRGETTCAALLGYKNAWVDGKKAVVVDEAVAPLVREAFQLAAEPGMSLRKVLAEVTRRGLRSKRGTPLGPSSMHKLLTNSYYYGMLRFRAKRVLATHQPLVSTELFDPVQRRLAGRAKR